MPVITGSLASAASNVKAKTRQTPLLPRARSHPTRWKRFRDPCSRCEKSNRAGLQPSQPASKFLREPWKIALPPDLNLHGESVVRVRTSSDLTSRSVQAKIANLHILRVFRNTSGTQASVSTHQTSTFTVIFGIFRENRRHDPVAHPHRPLAVT
jgi:hypothetical protein